MKLTCISVCIFLILGCQPATPKQETASVPIENLPIVAQQDSVAVSEVPMPITCTTKGKLIGKFKQNNAVFERFSNEDKSVEWLKITAKNGKCTIIDNIQRANYHDVSFRDWDKDGFKDRIDSWKWTYDVSLFDKKKNDFSRIINGVFNGEQWDFDKEKSLKYQYLDGKSGGIYELYKLVDTNKIVVSQIDYRTDYSEGTSDRIQIRKNIVETSRSMKFDTLKTDKQLFAALKPLYADGEVQITKAKRIVVAYWRKNLHLFLK